MSRILDVYLHEVLAGQLVQGKGGALSFAYDGAYVENGKPVYPCKSRTMTVQKCGRSSLAFCLTILCVAAWPSIWACRKKIRSRFLKSLAASARGRCLSIQRAIWMNGMLGSKPKA